MKEEEKKFHRCPLCGNAFQEETYACLRCPLGKACRRICCPRCYYPFVGESQTVHLLKRIFGGVKARKEVGR